MIVAATREREQELERSFSSPVAAEITKLEIEAVETGLEATTQEVASQASVANLQTPAAQTPELEIAEQCEIREYQPTAVEVEDLETPESRTGELTQYTANQKTLVEDNSSSYELSKTETGLGIKSDEQHELKIVLSLIHISEPTRPY